MRVSALGVGSHVGKSCILVYMGPYTLMLDCGMDTGATGHRMLPQIPRGDVDCLLITHAYASSPPSNPNRHVDHCGAIPYMVNKLGYSGPIMMTAPTRALCRFVLGDCSRQLGKVTRSASSRALGDMYSESKISSIIERVETIGMDERKEVLPGLWATALYAGHVLGAVMYLIETKSESLLYTGDYSTVCDRLLGPARVPAGICPDVCITEGTYATTLRNSRRRRERVLLQEVSACVEQGGTILIPISGIGRAQELFLLLHTFLQQRHQNVPIYCSKGMLQLTTELYRQFASWTSQDVQKQCRKRSTNPLDFSFILDLPVDWKALPGPKIIFASPASIGTGVSWDVFCHIHKDPASLIMIPGFCFGKSVGSRLLDGARSITVDGQTYSVQCNVSRVPYSEHTDAKGIMQMLQRVQPRHTIFVHCDVQQVTVLAKTISRILDTTIHIPSTKEPIHVDTHVQADVWSNTDAATRHLRDTLQ